MSPVMSLRWLLKPYINKAWSAISRESKQIQYDTEPAKSIFDYESTDPYRGKYSEAPHDRHWTTNFTSVIHENNQYFPRSTADIMECAILLRYALRGAQVPHILAAIMSTACYETPSLQTSLLWPDFKPNHPEPVRPYTSSYCEALKLVIPTNSPPVHRIIARIKIIDDQIKGSTEEDIANCGPSRLVFSLYTHSPEEICGKRLNESVRSALWLCVPTCRPLAEGNIKRDDWYDQPVEFREEVLVDEPYCPINRPVSKEGVTNRRRHCLVFMARTLSRGSILALDVTGIESPGPGTVTGVELAVFFAPKINYASFTIDRSELDKPESAVGQRSFDIWNEMSPICRDRS